MNYIAYGGGDFLFTKCFVAYEDDHVQIKPNLGQLSKFVPYMFDEESNFTGPHEVTLEEFRKLSDPCADMEMIGMGDRTSFLVWTGWVDIYYAELLQDYPQIGQDLESFISLQKSENTIWQKVLELEEKITSSQSQQIIKTFTIQLQELNKEIQSVENEHQALREQVN